MPPIIFTTAPTGLGHLRVMHALLAGLPPGQPWVEMGMDNVRANKIHSLGSRIPLLTKITEFYQTNPIAEAFVAGAVIFSIRIRPSKILKHFEVFSQKFSGEKTWVVVATHYALAHLTAAAKTKIEKKFGVKIYLATVVTDDSPQRVWAVNGADVIFTPSEKTRSGLSHFLKDPNILKTTPFPVSPLFAVPLKTEQYERIQAQLDPANTSSLHIQISVSGAAVQLPFTTAFVSYLSNFGLRFTIVGQQSVFTKDFFQKTDRLPRVQNLIGQSAVETVNYYEGSIMQESRAALEVTKPSEQAFKALLSPSMRGGLILLLTPPVGRQEKDNLDFLIRHKLMPDQSETKALQALLIEKGSIHPDDLSLWRYKASHWRAVSLPEDPAEAAKFVMGLKNFGIFLSMLSYTPESQVELGVDGVSKIWQTIDTDISSRG